MESQAASPRVLYAGPESATSDCTNHTPRQPGIIYITSHPVLFDFFPDHTAIEFNNGEETRWLSAGFEGWWFGEGLTLLVGGVGTLGNGFMQTDSENETVGILNPPEGLTPGEYFDVLINAVNNYIPVDYDLIPTQFDGYNSNGFTRGLIEATGGTTEADLSAYWGWGKPVPKENFGY